MDIKSQKLNDPSEPLCHTLVHLFMMAVEIFLSSAVDGSIQITLILKYPPFFLGKKQEEEFHWYSHAATLTQRQE